jgi:hypothetical protein
LSWKEYIIDHLPIRKAHSQLVLDKTGVLTHRRFLDFIKSRSFPFAVAHSLMDILSLIKKKNCLIIAPFLEIPSYLDGKIDIQILDYQHLPLEIDLGVVKSLTVDQLISLLKYRSHTGEIHLITYDTIKQELSNAGQFEKKAHVNKLVHKIKAAVSKVESCDDLLELGEAWGSYIYACFDTETSPDNELTSEVDQATERLVLEGGLKNAFYATESQLKTVNKIRPYLDLKANACTKLALICFDGMGTAEWMLLKTYLADIGFKFSERYLFALIPTITKISRSSIFHGDCISVYSLKTLDEVKQFSKHFSDRTCRFFREGILSSAQHLLGIDLVVVIYNFLDEIAHDSNLPPGDHTKFVYFKNVLTYLNRSKVKDELLLLKQQDYTIFICSDHGCVVGSGNGQRIDKYLIEESSKRATLIEKTDLAQFYDVNHYQIPFLSEDKVALLAKDRTMFAHKNYSGISHGGITLEELIVPFAEVNT